MYYSDVPRSLVYPGRRKNGPIGVGKATTTSLLQVAILWSVAQFSHRGLLSEEGERQKSTEAGDKDTAESNTVSPEQGAAGQIRRKARRASSASRGRSSDGGGSAPTTPPDGGDIYEGDVHLN